MCAAHAGGVTPRNSCSIWPLTLALRAQPRGDSGKCRATFSCLRRGVLIAPSTPLDFSPEKLWPSLELPYTIVKKEPHACAVIVEIVVLRAWPPRFRDHRAAAMMAAFKFAVPQPTHAVALISLSL